jgi:hypothetical protein
MNLWSGTSSDFRSWLEAGAQFGQQLRVCAPNPAQAGPFDFPVQATLLALILSSPWLYTCSTPYTFSQGLKASRARRKSRLLKDL